MSRVAHGHFGVSEKFLRCFHVFASFRYWYVDNLRVSWNRGMTKNVQIYQLRIYLHNSGNQSIRICNIYIPSKKTWTSLLFIIISKPEPLYITETSFNGNMLRLEFLGWRWAIFCIVSWNYQNFVFNTGSRYVKIEIVAQDLKKIELKSPWADVFSNLLHVSLIDQ